MTGEALLGAVGWGMGLGFFMGSWLVGIGFLLLSQWQKNPPKWLRLLKQVPLQAIALPLTGIIILYWGLIGAGLGVFALWLGTNFPLQGLGSSNLTFTLSILFLTGLGLLFFRRKEWLLFLGTFAGVFGWLLPYLIH